MSNYSKTRNFLNFRNRHSLHTTHKIIKKYGIRLGLQAPEVNADHTKFKLHIEEICTRIQEDWDKFIKFYKEVEYSKRSRNSSRERVTSHNYIQEALKYTNGCTDDF